MKLSGIVAAAIIVAIILAGGCALSPVSNQSAPPSPAATPSPTPIASNEPHVVTNLAELSSANTVAVLVPGQMPTPGTAAAASTNTPNTTLQANIDRFFTASAGNLRYTESSEPPPGETTLMNAKAEKFGDFAYALLKQTMTAAQTLEVKKFAQRKLSSELKPVVLTAVMTPIGRLTEITIDQHSGDIAVDQVVIAACEQGLWARNPPKEAADGDGNFRFRVQGIIYNQSFDRNGKYTYDTRLGLAIL